MTAISRIAAPILPARGRGFTQRALAGWQAGARTCWIQPPAPRRIRKAGRKALVSTLLLLASAVLVATRLLLRARLLPPQSVAGALRLSSGLTWNAMRLWRRGRVRGPT
jgi:hypothetical protein